MSRLPLEGIRIIDSTWVVAMPYAMSFLGNMGAEVIKKEAIQRMGNRSAGGGPGGISGTPDNA